MATHTQLKNAYFWTPPSNASGRRHMEEKFTRRVEFRLNGIKYVFSQDVRCSCKNVYYSSEIFYFPTGEIAPKYTDIRLAKKLVKTYSPTKA